MKYFKYLTWITILLTSLGIAFWIFSNPVVNSATSSPAPSLHILKKRPYPVSLTPVQSKFVVTFSSQAEAHFWQKQLTDTALQLQLGISILPDAAAPTSQLIVTLIGPSAALDNFFQKISKNN